MRIAYSSLRAFKTKADLLASLLKLKRQQGLEKLSRASGYGNYHEACHTDLTVGGIPTVEQVAAQLAQAIPMADAEALRIAEALNLHAGPASSSTDDADARRRFDNLYHPPFSVSRRALEKFDTARHQKQDQDRYPPLDPAEQAKALKVYRSPAYHLLTAPPAAAHTDLPKAPFGQWEGDADFSDSIDRYLASTWVETIYALYEKQTGHAVPEDVPDAAWKEMAQFATSPTDEVARSNPILSVIPDVAGLAKQWEPYHRQHYAKYCHKSQLPYAMLDQGMPLSAEDAARIGFSSLWCTIALRATTFLSQEDFEGAMSIWEFSACFARTEPGNHRAEPVALMQGTYIVPYGKRAEASAGFFADMMDAHSAMLNDVWKEIEFQYLPEHGFASIEEYDGAIAVPHVEIAPAYRGKGLLPLVLNLFRDTLEGYPFNQVDVGWERCAGDNRVDDEPEFELGSPSVFVFQVEGTRPGRLVAMPIMMRSPQQVEVTTKDPDVERRKDKLTAYFLSLGEQIDADVVVYDPWSYPIT